MLGYIAFQPVQTVIICCSGLNLCIQLIIPKILLTDSAPCEYQVKVKPTTLEKGGIPFTKLVVDSEIPITIPFAIPTVVEIGDLSWKLNGHPIDVDKDEEKSAVYWKSAPGAVQLVVRVPSRLFSLLAFLLFYPFQFNPFFAEAQYIGNWEMLLGGTTGEKISRTCQLKCKFFPKKSLSFLLPYFIILNCLIA